MRWIGAKESGLRAEGCCSECCSERGGRDCYICTDRRYMEGGAGYIGRRSMWAMVMTGAASGTLGIIITVGIINLGWVLLLLST